MSHEVEAAQENKGSCRQLASLILYLSLIAYKAQAQLAPMAGMPDMHLTGHSY